MSVLTRAQTKIFQKWFENLSGNMQDKIAAYVNRVLSGNDSNSEPAGNNISEIKINYQKGYRVYYAIIKNQTVLLLLLGGDKHGNRKAQQEDIAKAKMIKAFLEQKGEI